MRSNLPVKYLRLKIVSFLLGLIGLAALYYSGVFCGAWLGVGLLLLYILIYSMDFWVSWTIMEILVRGGEKDGETKES